MITETSKQAYKELNEDGTSTSQKNKIWRTLIFNRLPMSLREIAKDTGYDINAVSGRVNDLKKKGKIWESVRRACSITRKIIVPVTAHKEYKAADKQEDPALLIKEYSKKFNELSLLKAKITSFVPREQINAFKLRCFIAEFTLPESFEEVLKLNEEKS